MEGMASEDTFGLRRHSRSTIAMLSFRRFISPAIPVGKLVFSWVPFESLRIFIALKYDELRDEPSFRTTSIFLMHSVSLVASFTFEESYTSRTDSSATVVAILVVMTG